MGTKMTETGDDYVLKLDGNGISIDMSVDRTKARKILNIALSDAGEGPDDVPSVSTTAPPRAGRSLSLREYFDRKEAFKKHEQILAIAGFMAETEGLEDVARDEIKSRFSLAREPLPANFPRDFATVLRNGWLAPAHGKQDRFYVTQSGIQALESNFKAPARRPAASRKRSIKNKE
jgi:hypothetical protein